MVMVGDSRNVKVQVTERKKPNCHQFLLPHAGLGASPSLPSSIAVLVGYDINLNHQKSRGDRLG